MRVRHLGFVLRQKPVNLGLHGGHAFELGIQDAPVLAGQRFEIGEALVQPFGGAFQRRSEGTIFLGVLVLGVFVLANIERTALGGRLSRLAFTMTVLCVAACVHYASEREHSGGRVQEPEP